MSLVAVKNTLLSILRANDNREDLADSSSSSPSFSRSPEEAPLLRPNRTPTDLLDDDLESQASSTQVSVSSADSSASRRLSARIISDATIGLSDGLTVPFALTAGLSALDDTKIVIYGGLAELIAGAISMGLGGYLGAKSEIASYKETLAQTNKLIATDPDGTLSAVRSVFEPYDVPKETLDGLATHITSSPELADFLMRFQHCEPEPQSFRAIASGVTIALGYFLGGLLPLLPYLCVAPDDLRTGFLVSVAVMAVALFSFGYAKTCMVCGWRGARSVRKGLIGALQMVVVGGSAAAAAMLLVELFDSMANRGGG